MNNDTQIMKGILEGCILKIVFSEELYGYKTVERLNDIGFETNEATVYPILTRLENKGLLKTEKRPSPLGPARKYYFLTNQGKVELEEFMVTWQRISTIVNQVMEENNHDNQK